MRIPSGVTDQYIYFVAVDATDFTTRETGLSSFTVRRSRNGGASAAYTTPTINETDSSNMPGVYELLLDEDMTIDSGDDTQEVCLHITHAGMAPVTRTFELYRPKITAGETLTASSGIGSANVVQISGDAPAADNAKSFFDGTGYAGTNNVIPTVTTLTNLPAITANWLTAAGIADGAIDRATFAADTGLQTIRSNTAQAGAATTITLDASASATNDFYNQCRIYLTGGTGVGQSRKVLDYVGSTKVATVRAWITNPDNTTTFAILPEDSVWDDITADHLTSGSTGVALNAAGSAGDPWSTTLPGAYGAGSAGYILGTNLDGTVSSRSSQSSVNTIDDFLDTEVAAILAAVDTEIGGIITLLGTPAGASVSADILVIDNFVDDLETRLTAARAGYLDNLSAGAVALEATAQTILGDTNELQTDWANGGRLDLLLDATLADTNELQTDWVNGGRLDLILDARASQTSVDDLPTNAELTTALGTADDAVLAALTTLSTDVAAIPTNAELATAIAAGWTTVISEPSARTDGSAGTPAQILYELLASQQEKAISGTTMLWKKLNGSTTLATMTLDSSTTPTAVTRSS